MDVHVLYETCAGKHVVEFGVGGSTLILAQCAASVVSFDTDATWIDRTAHKLSKLENVTAVPQLRFSADVPEEIPQCDVLFIDGYGPHRKQWLKHFHKCKLMICHDSLGDTGSGPTLYHIMSDLFADKDIVELLDKTIYHYRSSNMVLTYKRDQPIKYVNWNISERDDNRHDPYAT